MGEVFSDGCLLAAVGLSWALAVWFALGWDGHALMRATKGEFELVGRAVAEVWTSLVAHIAPSSEESGAPTLGDVSEMIDVVRLGLSAGLSFDAALGLYCEHRAGTLSRSMGQARLSWQMGMAGREEALMGVAHETGIRALESFAVAVGQALTLGAPLADTLASQGDDCRAAHRAEVERQIECAPVKLLIPTGTLILPALLLSIMGPLLAAGGMI